MGCDIHFYVERYTSDKEPSGPTYHDISDKREMVINDILDMCKIEDRWISADTWKKVDTDYWKASSLYSGRNYWLFAKLADVRNYDSIDPLSEPKGIPTDASSAYRYIHNKFGMDAHSASYFTLQELLDFKVDWNNICVQFKDTIEKMKLIDPDYTKVRCVFFFDN